MSDKDELGTQAASAANETVLTTKEKAIKYFSDVIIQLQQYSEKMVTHIQAMEDEVKKVKGAKVEVDEKLKELLEVKAYLESELE